MIFVYRGPALPLVTRTSAEISPFMFFNSSLIQDGRAHSAEPMGANLSLVGSAKSISC